MELTTLAALSIGTLGGAGCGDTTVTVTKVITPTPGGSSPPVVVTSTPSGGSEGPTPIANGFSGAMNSGDCKTLQPGPTANYTVSGDVTVGGRRLFDDDGKSGMLVTVTGSQTVEVCSPFGANVTNVDPSELNQQENTVIKQMIQTGCENNSGCPDGIQTFNFANGTITNTGIRR